MLTKRSLWVALKISSRRTMMSFANKDRYDQEFQDYEIGGIGSQRTEYETSQSSTSRRPTFQRRDKIEFSKETLDVFTNYNKSEAMEHLHTLKRNQTIEDFLLLFFDSIRSKEGYIAFNELDIVKKEQFTDNLVLLIQDSLATQTRLSIVAYARTTIGLLINSGSPQLITKFIQNMFSVIKSVPIKYNILNGFFLAISAKKRVIEIQELFKCADICQQYLYEILKDSRTRLDGRSISGIGHALANLLNYCSHRSFKAEFEHLEFFIRIFLSLPILELPPMALVTGYNAIGNLILERRFQLSFENKSNRQFMDSIIRKFFSENEDKQMDDYVGEEMDQQEDSDSQLTPKKIHSFLQALFLENEENWNYKNSFLYNFASNTKQYTFEEPFRRWLVKLFQIETFSFNSFTQWEQLFTIINVMLKGKGAQKLKMKLIFASRDYFEKVSNIEKLIEMFSILMPFKWMIENTSQSKTSKIMNQNEFSEDEKRVIQEVFDYFKSRFLNCDKPLSIKASLKIIFYLKIEFNSLTFDELKETRIHKNLWPKLLETEFPIRILNELMITVPAYDILNDTQIQTHLLTILNRFPDMKSLGKKRTKYSFYNSFLTLYDLFMEHQSQLNEESKVFFEKLSEIKQVLDSV